MTDPPAAYLPPPAMLASGTAAAVLAALPEGRAVGGAVRDTLAGLPVHDIDVAVPLPPDEVGARLARAGLAVHETGLAHGTLTAVRDGEPVEVTSLRRDVATDGRHATVAWSTDWREDAGRRDFTINAMSMAADGRLWDYFSGREDLRAGRVRFVGDAATRLAEDFLRALRFFRFQARYGRGAPDADAVAAIAAAVPGLARLSAERVWMEIKRLLVAANPSDAVRLAAALGVLPAILPEGAEPERLARMVARGLPADPMLRFAVLVPLGVEARLLASRLRWSAAEAEMFETLRAIDGTPGPDEAARGFGLRAWRAQVRQRSTLVAPTAVLWVAEAERGGEGWDTLRDLVSTGSDPVFPLQGRDVLALGVPPGPDVGRLLAEARKLWAERDTVVSERVLREHLHRLIQTSAADPTG